MLLAYLQSWGQPHNRATEQGHAPEADQNQVQGSFGVPTSLTRLPSNDLRPDPRPPLSKHGELPASTSTAGPPQPSSRRTCILCFTLSKSLRPPPANWIVLRLDGPQRDLLHRHTRPQGIEEPGGKPGVRREPPQATRAEKSRAPLGHQLVARTFHLNRFHLLCNR